MTFLCILFPFCVQNVCTPCQIDKNEEMENFDPPPWSTYDVVIGDFSYFIALRGIRVYISRYGYHNIWEFIGKLYFTP